MHGVNSEEPDLTKRKSFLFVELLWHSNSISSPMFCISTKHDMLCCTGSGYVALKYICAIWASFSCFS
jgi:hypothetical protein